jgi:hypothetical protein
MVAINQLAVYNNQPTTKLIIKNRKVALITLLNISNIRA